MLKELKAYIASPLARDGRPYHSGCQLARLRSRPGALCRTTVGTRLAHP